MRFKLRQNKRSLPYRRCWPAVLLPVILLITLLTIRLWPATQAMSIELAEMTLQVHPTSPAGQHGSERIEAKQDAFLSSRHPDTNFGGESILRLGWSTSDFDAARILIEFDVSQLPRPALITKAEFHIFQWALSPPGDPNPLPYRAQFIGTPWDELGVTWNNAHDLGGDTLLEDTVEPGIGWKTVDATELVTLWYLGARANYGLIATGDETPAANRQRAFYAREEEDWRPFLLVEYTLVCDNLPPTTTMAPLHEYSLDIFQVAWSGTDAAPADCPSTGIAYYSVEYRINGGAWTTWQGTTALTALPFETLAASSDLVEFRSRAADQSGNIAPFGNAQASTRIDTEPPLVIVNLLPPVTTATSFMLTWQAVDNLSGVSHYDVQWRENSGPWQTLLETTAQTGHHFTGAQDGVTYDFRVRAADALGNTSLWNNEPQASTKVITAHATAQVTPFVPNVLKPTAAVTTSFPVNWVGFDTPEAPIATVEIYYQHNHGPWQLWQIFPAGQPSAQFPLQQLGFGDGLYGFESVAVNTLGIREPVSLQAEATIIVDLADAIQVRTHIPLVFYQVSGLAHQ